MIRRRRFNMVVKQLINKQLFMNVTIKQFKHLKYFFSFIFKNKHLLNFPPGENVLSAPLYLSLVTYIAFGTQINTSNTFNLVGKYANNFYLDAIRMSWNSIRNVFVIRIDALFHCVTNKKLLKFYVKCCGFRTKNSIYYFYFYPMDSTFLFRYGIV